jgi:putative two-component system response regulator
MNEKELVERPVVCVVDDTPLNLMLMENILQKDYTLKLFSDAQQALDYAFATPPDVILLDVMMPDIDGFEACRRLKANPLTRDVPVIFITAKNEIADEELGFSLGASDFIHKPISAPIVAARVKTHLKVKLVQDFFKRENVRLKENVNENQAELAHLKNFIWGGQLEKR